MKVLITPRSFGKNDPMLFTQLEELGFELVRNETGGILTEDALCEKIEDCDAVILGVDPCTAKVINNAKKLKIIARYGVGLDNVDQEACAARGIKIYRTLGANANAVADFAFALMLAVARKVPLIDRNCRVRNWSKTTSIDVSCTSLGIIGFGAVGREVARRARGFTMRVFVADPYVSEEDLAKEKVTRASIDEICKNCDFITLHATLTEETRRMINAERLSSMKKTAVLINTARGGLVDEAALLQALKENRIYGAGLDVFEQEPPLEKEWYSLENVVLASHTSSSTIGTTNTMGRNCVDTLREFFCKK